MSEKPTLDQLTTVLRKAAKSSGWIGEGKDVVREILDYIDGEDDDFATWALALCDHCGRSPGRGHFRDCPNRRPDDG